MDQISDPAELLRRMKKKEPEMNKERFARANREDVLLDEQDEHIWKSRSWIKTPNGYIVACGRKNNKPTFIRLHRLIMNAPDGMDVDHINRNRSDNRRSNLRICTRSQNLCNTARRSDNKTGFKGVSFYKSRGQYEAYINLNGKRKKLGYFATAEEANSARQKAIAAHHGAFRAEAST